MISPTLDTRPVRVPAHGGGGVLSALDGTDHVLNATALALWRLCDGQTTVQEMAGAVHQLFGVPAPQATGQVLEAVAALGEAGLVRWD